MTNKFRYWDQFNGVMVYSEKFKNLSLFFKNYQLAVDGENNPILMSATPAKDWNNNDIYQGDRMLCKTEKGENILTIEHVNHSNYSGFKAYGKNRRFHTNLSFSFIANMQAVVTDNIYQKFLK